MGHRLTRIVTRTGDDGTTGLSDGSRIAKDAALMEAIGTVDELNSVIGFAEALCTTPDLNDALIDIQHDLFDLGGSLSIPDRAVLTDAHVARLERLAEDWNAQLPPLREFVLPGGTQAAGALHMARTVCRRAERRLLSVGEGRMRMGRVYLNRLSDLLFVAARRSADGRERSWQKNRSLSA